ncbi:virulence-associated protein VapC [Nostoc sp. LPT]|uniref:virulence-associated protein VapC n=1 Tax=Nostoc sp. LPT TaxID=2815387 RepID=UPI0025DF317B|nr:virulence-associated protein VapC [Nostoc sp. LPT]
MTYQYLLDTNIISDLVRHPQGLMFQRLAAVDENWICTSIIVVFLASLVYYSSQSV